MKNIATNNPQPAVQTTMFMENEEISVRDKNLLQQRLLNTQLVKPPHFKILPWGPEDVGIEITFQHAASVFGNILAASTSKGLCYLGFDFSKRMSALDDLKRRFPQSTFIEKTSPFQETAIKMMNDPHLELPLPLHLKGTDFQLQIWERLSHIPMGGFTSYAQIGGSNERARATGTAVGSNPISYLLPCHRVIHTDGSFKGYYWGTEVKEQILIWEIKAVTGQAQE